MSHQLTKEFGDSLGLQGLFLHKLFHDHSQLIAQLQMANSALEDCEMDTQRDVSNVATRAMCSVAQTILMNLLTGSHLSWSAKAAEPESFDRRSRDKTKQFVQAIHTTVTMQINTFVDKQMKILYALLYMHGGMAQVWAANETNMVLSNMSTITTLNFLLSH